MLVTAPIPLYNVGFSWVGASIRRGAFIRGERLIQIYNPGGGGGGELLLDTRGLFETGRLLDHLNYIAQFLSKE